MATSVINTAGLVAGYVEPVVGVNTFLATVTPAANSLDVAWDAVAGATSYTVYCGIVMGQLSPVATLLASNATSYSIDSLRTTQQYFVQVTATFSSNHSIGSVTVDGDLTVPTELLPFVPIEPTLGTVQFSSATYSDSTGAIPESYVFTVTRSGDTTLAASVHYATSDGTLTAPTNYTATSGTLSWGAGDGADKTFSVPILSGAETQFFNLTLSSPSGVTLGFPNTATFTLFGV